MDHQPTLRVTVRLGGHLRRFGAGKHPLTLPHPATVRSALRALADTSPELRAALLDAAGEPCAQILLFVDDEQSDAERVLSDNASLTLLLPISGG